MKNKVAAFTLMEVTVAMLISAVCISICFTAYSLISRYYVAFDEKNKHADHALGLKNVLERDVLKANYLIKTEDGALVENDTTTITYVFNEKQVFRQHHDLHTDTFKIQVQDLNLYFEDQQVRVTDTVDRINLTLLIKSKVAIPIEINKNYSSADLFK